MNLYSLVFQQQNRYKFWNWDELFALTNLTPTQIKKIVDCKGYQLQDPLSSLLFSHKNHDQRAIDNIFDNYSNHSRFELQYNDYGLSTNFILQSQNPTWQNYNHNQDWYWKQNWIYKYGQLLTTLPGVKNIYLSCSASLENSHCGSDVDLMIQTHKNWVWVSKVYFAVLSKVLKYYNLNFGLALFYFITNQVSELKSLKRDCIENKIKIDFGLVFEDEKDLEKYYSSKERNIFIWSALKLTNVENKIEKIKFKSNLEYGNIVYKSKVNLVSLMLIKFTLLLTVLITFPLGIANFWYEQKNKNDYNKLVLWNVYSQYNLVY